MDENAVTMWVSRAHLDDLGWQPGTLLFDPETRVLMGSVEEITPARAGGVDVMVRPMAAELRRVREQGRGIVLTWVAWHVAWPGEPRPGEKEWEDDLRAVGLLGRRGA